MAVPFGVVLLGMVLLTAGVLYLGVRQLRNALAEPFQVKQLDGGHVGPPLQDQNADLRAKDTDKDGLSDYDETYLHRTSPYLPDSDADGAGDKAEVEAKTDPNCPEGKSCYGGLATTPPPPPFDSSSPGSSSLRAGSSQGGGASLGQQELSDQQTPSAAQLREALKKAGVSDDVLGKVSDEELLKEYGAFLGEQATTTTPQPPPSQGGGITPDNLFNLSGSQIRELLKSSGGEAVPGLEQLTDQQLEELFKQAIQQQGGQQP